MVWRKTGRSGENNSGRRLRRQNKKSRNAAVMAAAAVKNETISEESEFE